MMLDKILTRLGVRDAKAQDIDDTKPFSYYIPTDPSDYFGMRVYHRLESTKPTKHRHRKKLETEWQLPLPYDLMFTIIHGYLLDDKPTMLNLTKSSRSLAQVCGPLCYQRIVITSRCDPKGVSDSERFATLLSLSPHIIEYIRDLKILHIFKGSRPMITAEEQSLCYILTRRYAKLSSLHLSLPVMWSILPIQLQHACSVAFTLPNLRKVVFERAHIPITLLTPLSKISHLEFRKGSVWSYSMNLEVPSEICTPERLIFMDHSPTGLTTMNLLAETSPLRLSKLKHLQTYCKGLQLKLLSEPLQACSTTLTTLKFYISTYGGIPDIFDLRDLPMLSSLTLSADISMMTYGGLEGPQRFFWLVNTLGTCYQPSRVDNIKFMILTREFGFTDQLAWRNLDALFAQHSGIRWPRLKRFIIQYFNDLGSYVKEYEEEKLEKIILPRTPILAAADLLRFTISDQYLGFWRM